MNNLNSILIEGNLVRDPLYRATPKGTPVCTFSLACNRYHKQDSNLDQEVSFFDVETWAKLAEISYSLGRKGRGVRVIGRLKQDRWVDTEGKNHARITIVAEHVEFKPDFRRSAAKPAEGSAAVDASTETAAEDTAAAIIESAMETETQAAGFSEQMSADPVEIEDYEMVSF